MKRHIRFQIPLQWDGTPSVDFLTARFPYHSREEWLARLLEGRIQLNDRAADIRSILHQNDVIEYLADGIPEPMVNDQVEILFSDPDIVVINKPPNLPCHPGGRYFNNTLWSILKSRHGLEEPIFVNRLDRETSGLVLVARNNEAARHCRKQFSSRTVTKRYLALVEGQFPSSMPAVGQLVADPSSPVRKKRRFIPDPGPPPDASDDMDHVKGEAAETRFRRISIHGPVSQIEAIPSTGRLHQIRATLQSLGFPIVGDKLYGPDPQIFIRFCQGVMTDNDRTRLRLPRQALHASGLSIRHPRTKERMDLSSPLPADLISFLHSQSRQNTSP